MEPEQFVGEQDVHGREDADDKPRYQPEPAAFMGQRRPGHHVQDGGDRGGVLVGHLAKNKIIITAGVDATVFVKQHQPVPLAEYPAPEDKLLSAAEFHSHRPVPQVEVLKGVGGFCRGIGAVGRIAVLKLNRTVVIEGKAGRLPLYFAGIDCIPALFTGNQQGVPVEETLPGEDDGVKGGKQQNHRRHQD